jgi:hypothetical protein
MEDDTAAASGSSALATEALAPATSFFTVGAELLSEVQRIIGTNRVRCIRVKLGSRVVKEIPIRPLTAVATVLLVLAAVVVSTMSIEVEHEPVSSPA